MTKHRARLLITTLLMCGDTFTWNGCGCGQDELRHALFEDWIAPLYPFGMTHITYYVTEKGKELLK